MPGYAIGVLKDVRMNVNIVRYLAEIGATLAPWHGRFIIHGGPRDIREGDRLGDVIVIEFPDIDSAKAWYDSPPYQEIVGLRTGSSIGSVFIIEGVDVHHRGVGVLPEAMRPSARSPTTQSPGIVVVDPATRAETEFGFPP